MTSRRRSKTLISLFASASVAAMVTAGAAGATTAPPGTDAAGTEPAGTEAAAGSEAATGTDGAAEGGSGGVGEVGGSGCGVPHGPWDEAESAPAGEVRVAWNDPLLSFNSTTTRGNATANNNPLYLMNLGGFSFYDADLQLTNNDAFGTCTIESLDPLTITYRVNEGVTWSDGVQVDAADMILGWGSANGQFNDENTVVTSDTGETAEADAEGNPIITGPEGDISAVDDPEAYDAAYDPETGALLEGYTYKVSAGVAFDTTNVSMAAVGTMPTISEDGLAVTATWDTFYVDYQISGVPIGVPAHVVAQNALGIEDPAEAKQALLDAFANDDSATLKPIADFWNTGFDTDELPDNPALYIGFGPYNLTAYEQRTQMTFEAREDYTWGPTPGLQTIVYRIIGDPTAAAQAMENEEVDIIAPQATADLLTQLEGLADRGIEVIQGDGATYEHVDLAVNNGGPFDPAAYGGDEATALAVRQAFLKTIPRQEIVDRLIVPLVPTAEVRNSYTQVPGSPWYDTMVEANGMAVEYAEVDIEGAQQLLADAGITDEVDVRFHYAANNPRRAAEYELIRDSAAQAGFNVIDGNSPDWGAQLSNTDIYDAAMFGWQSTSINVSDSQANFSTGEINNFYGYSNPEVDALYEELQSATDPARQEEILAEVEAHLVADAFGLTLFQHESITAYNSTYVDGVSSIAIAPTVFFNVWEWQPAG